MEDPLSGPLWRSLLKYEGCVNRGLIFCREKYLSPYLLMVPVFQPLRPKDLSFSAG